MAATVPAPAAPARPRAPRLARGLARHSDFGRLHETFLISAIATILVIRTQLWATNYPQLGGNGLHIAHLLWGGLIMTLVIMSTLTYVGRSLRPPAAVFGGIGFGFFIDELGKFITDDNDYFFAPVAGLIYLIFIAMFLVSRAMQHRRALTSAEYVANALEIAAQGVRRAFYQRDREEALALIDRADAHDPATIAVRDLIARTEVVREPPLHSLTGRIVVAIRRRAAALVARAGFQRAVAVVFALWALGSTLVVLSLVLSVGLELGQARPGAVSDEIGDLTVTNIASLASSVAAGGLVIGGVLALKKGRRMQCYRLFDRALLVQILITNVFSFLESQFAAVFGAGLNIALLVALRYVQRREASR